MARKTKQTEVAPGAVLAEFVGTFALSFALLASINGIFGGLVPAAAIVGFTMFLIFMAFGSISGAHVNPGITLGLLSIRRIEVPQAVTYIIAQIAGAFSAAAIMNLLLDGSMLTISAGANDSRIFLAEVMGMMFFAAGVAGAVTHEYKGLEAAATIGGSLFLGIMFASVASNAILNPALAFSVDSVNATYLLAPLFGGVLGMIAFDYIKSQS